ncbi:MAG: hypothetical protein ACRDJL_06770 [Actinomycetota bacterium]
MNDEPRTPGEAEDATPPPWRPPPPPSSEQATDHRSYMETHSHRTCPACGEPLTDEAFVCKRCRYNLRTEAFVDARSRANGLASASLIMGLVALMIFPLIPLSALGGFLALVMGAVSRRQINNSNGALSGAEMARFGLLLGVVSLLVALGLTIVAYVLDIEVVTVNLSD